MNAEGSKVKEALQGLALGSTMIIMMYPMTLMIQVILIQNKTEI